MGNKRKERQSSGNTSVKENDSKVFKLRGPSKESESESESITISGILNETNTVLYGPENKSESDCVFNESCSGTKMSTEAKGQVKEGPTNAYLLAYLEKINGRICNVEKRLDSLSVIEEKVDRFDRELKKLWVAMEDRNKSLDRRLSDAEEKSECTDFNVAQLESKVTQIQKEKDLLKSEVVYLTSQSMRNNLIFTNILEAAEEDQQKTECALRDHLVSKLKITQDLLADMKFERVHRIGERKGGKIRNTVAKFVLYEDREYVRKQWKRIVMT